MKVKVHQQHLVVIKWAMYRPALTLSICVRSIASAMNLWASQVPAANVKVRSLLLYKVKFIRNKRKEVFSKVIGIAFRAKNFTVSYSS